MDDVVRLLLRRKDSREKLDSSLFFEANPYSSVAIQCHIFGIVSGGRLLLNPGGNHARQAVCLAIGHPN